MKLQQNQVWKKGGTYLRIVRVERLSVEYKASSELGAGRRKHHYVTKKDFCRLLKDATLLDDRESLLTPP